LRAIGDEARAASFLLKFGVGFTSTICLLDSLPPGQRLGPLGSIFIDNTANAVPVTITFPDTSAQDEVPAGATSWLLAITGGVRFKIDSAVTLDTTILVQVLNVVVPPTGVQAVSGDVTISTGVMSLAAGAAVIGHVIADAGSTVAVSALPALPAGGNVIGHVIADTGSTVAVSALPALAAGAAIIGNVRVDQTTPGTTNKVIAGIDQTTPGTTNKVAVSSWNGTAIDSLFGTALPASTFGVVAAPNTQPGVAMAASIAGAALTVANVKASAGNVYGVSVYNPNATVTFLQFYNTAGVPTLGTGVVWFIAVPPTGAVNIPPGTFALGSFATGIGIGASTTATGVGTPGVPLNATVFYK
jgi:hypothetical protein